MSEAHGHRQFQTSSSSNVKNRQQKQNLFFLYQSLYTFFFKSLRLTLWTSKEPHLLHHHKAQCQEAVDAEMPGN